jgi:hypothetical protein
MVKYLPTNVALCAAVATLTAKGGWIRLSARGAWAWMLHPRPGGTIMRILVLTACALQLGQVTRRRRTVIRVRHLVVAALLGAVFLSGSGRPANADELLAGNLYSFCTSNDQMVSNACRFYVLGVVQGVGLGDGSTMDASGKQMVERKKTIFCIPEDMSQTQMVSLVRDLLALDLKVYPEDRKLAAVGMVAGIMHMKFPCAPR